MNIGKTVAVDLDDTIANLRDPLQQLLDDFTGQCIPWKLWNTFKITDIYNISSEIFYNLIISSNILANIEPHNDTIETLNYLKYKKYIITIITSRSYHPEAYTITKHWLDKYKIPYNNIHISGNDNKKSKYANMYDTIMTIDDSIDNCMDYMNNTNIQYKLIMDMPWNVNDNKFQRIGNINEICNII